MEGEAVYAGGGGWVWHPAIRALGWIKDWILWAAFAGVLWEAIASDLTSTVSVGSILARTGTICAVIACSVIPFILIHNWLTIFQRLRSDYPKKFAFVAVVPMTIFFLAIAGVYAWLAQSLIQWTAGVLQAVTADIPRYEIPHVPSWLTLVALALALSFAFVSLRTLVSRHLRVWRLLGPKKTLKGYGIMTILRLRQPRKDFFAQAPLVRDLPVLALAAVLFDIVHPNFVAWPIAMLLLAASLGMSLHLLQPPTWFFLGRSHFDSFHTFDALRDSWDQFGVTLLNRDSKEWHDYYFARAAELVRRGVTSARFMKKPRTPREWSLRSRGDLWESTVALLMDLAPVIVLDAREKSYYVYDEVLWLTELNWIDKAWLIGNADGTAPALEGALEWAKEDNVTLAPNAGRALAARIVTEAQLCSAEWTSSGIQIKT